MKIKANYRILILMFLIAFPRTLVKAQGLDYTRVSISSPNSASLGKFADIPVNKHTGVPVINIPLYTIESGALHLPISLSYHAGGIKVTESASWVGTGWALNAGGMITRTVRGIPDEGVNSHKGQYGHYTNYGYSNYLTLTGDGGRTYDRFFETGERDGEPDLFTFNFNGYSGKFFFNDDRTAVIVENNDDLKIEANFRLANNGGILGMQQNIQGFTVTTKEGTKYYFGKHSTELPEAGYVYPIEVTRRYTFNNGLSSDVVFSSWYLTKIESFDRVDKIDLLYVSEKYSVYNIGLFPIFNVDQIQLQKGHELVRDYFDGVRLANITFNNGELIFKPGNVARLDLSGNSNAGGYGFTESVNTEAKALDEIEIRTHSAAIFKRIKFYTSYFEDQFGQLGAGLDRYTGSTIVSDKKRLKLDSLVECGSANERFSPYKFVYESSFLSRRLSLGQDHWGFYNAETTNTTLIPTITKNIYTEHYRGAKRDAKWPHMKGGTIKEIVYPTKGSVVFDFEPNKVYLNTVKHSLEYAHGFHVGMDGSYSKVWDNIQFTGNAKYQVIYRNDASEGIGGSQIASYNLKNKATGVTVSSVSVGAGETVTSTVTIPPGTYTLNMFRDSRNASTGAYLSFSKYVSADVQDPIVGGLRVKTITKKSGTGGADIIETYMYETNGRSTGYLYERPRYIQSLRNDVVKIYGFRSGEGVDNTPNLHPNGCLAVEGPNLSVPHMVAPYSVAPMSNYQGNHVGYDEVTVSYNNNAQGKSVYRYYNTNPWERETTKFAYTDVSFLCDPLAPNFPAAPIPFQFQRGQLKDEDHFDSEGKLRKAVTYLYSYDSTKVFTPALKVERGVLTEYTLRGYFKKRIETITTVNGSGPNERVVAIDTFFFESPYHRQMTKKSIDNSEGRRITNYKYAFDFRMPQADAISDGWTTYVNACQTCEIQHQQRTTTCGNDYNCIFRSFHQMRECKAAARQLYITRRRTNFTEQNSLYKSVFAGNKQNADNLLKPIWELHDCFTNVPIETVESKKGKTISAVFNRYAFFPSSSVNHVYPTGVMLLELSQPSSQFINSTNNNLNITLDTRYNEWLTLKFNNGRIVQSREKSASPVVYLWGYGGQYPVAKIENATYTEVLTALGGGSTPAHHSAATTILNNLSLSTVSEAMVNTYVQTIRANLQKSRVTTYTYKPLVGMTSMIDPRGITEYYQYDGFQRLKDVLDFDKNVLRNYQYHYRP
ncbi:hypothetical protein [Sphingobacterium haloxyli]|uniref:YD repeat-containing protein n=1 Tax=Sphingobacterium haloxyli TaxID=2100533 RepID=A0A2S9J0E4_9SPHI|nr:hypothetical protein [Sphingobacterium haloxyli]PRD46263.1 hypothetical protein C5745_15865 [Sphingobacterium haloxyli]